MQGDVGRTNGRLGADLLSGHEPLLDHLLAVYELFHRERCPSWWLTAGERASVVDGETVIRGAVGETVSFLPLGAVECRMRSCGLRWPLNEVRWVRGDVGICNELATEEARVSMISGRLLMIRPYEVSR